MPSNDYETDQILTAVGKFCGTSAADITPDIYGAICAAIMTVRCVASLGIHTNRFTGTVDGTVELNDGSVLTVSITEARVADPIKDLWIEIRDAIEGAEWGDFDLLDDTGTLNAISAGLATIIHDRDVRIADLEGHLASGQANLIAKVASLEGKLAPLEGSNRHPWTLFCPASATRLTSKVAR